MDDHRNDSYAAPDNGWLKQALNPWRISAWGLALLLLVLPAIAMHYTPQVRWDETDFLVMGLMLGGMGLAAEWMIRRSPNLWSRAASVVSLLTVFLTIWANLAVGMIGSEDSPFNLLFAGVPVIALIGSAMARLKPRGMAISHGAAAAAQAGIAAMGAQIDARGGTFSALFAGLWLIAAVLYWLAASRAEGTATSSR